MEERAYVIEIEGTSPADANRYAEELRDILRGATSEVKVEQRRADAEAQDFGATLVLILGTPVAIVLASAFRDWLNRRDSVRLHFKTPEGEILLENISAKDARKILELFEAAK
jgi:hypothetical protein